ncbi:uncharacterized protein N7459_003827 [Penicillium hispanicum]|uniref:uncharacterized protein n=1 Tax=Penicillium hispanicum TaxID=1080232 RepID=UPI00253F9038|nr:uncharacterized protein N7459_003827 [Penicillium hispanicum]KAJ5584027.1 hypothetical protein N7459_003827 [Penicillium hispanicum]
MESNSMTAVIGPPPAGIDLKANRAPRDNVVVIVICVVTALVVIARFVLKLRSEKPKPRMDDWLCAAALVPLFALLAAALLGECISGNCLRERNWPTPLNPFRQSLWLGQTCLGVDHHWDGEGEEGEKRSGGTWESKRSVAKEIQILFAYLLIYIFELAIIKMSILLFYRRIFGMNWLNWLGMSLTGVWFIGSVIALLCSPDPVSFFWSQTSNPYGGHYRYDFYNYYIGNAAGNVATDVLILTVPIPVVWRLQMRVLQKIMVSTVLLLGVFVCAASIIRLHFLTFLKDDIDISWTISNVYVWSTVEPCVGIVCACLPVLQPIIRSAMRMEYLIYIRRRMTGVRKPSTKRTSQTMSLHKRSSHSSHRMTPIDSLDGKPELGLRRHNDEIGLVSVAARAESDGGAHRERKSLEDYLGPMFIRVQHEVEWSVEET